MIRILIPAALAFAAFLGAIVVPMALTGTLNVASLMRLLGQEDGAPASAAEVPDEIDALSKSLKAELEAVRLRAERLAEREARLDTRDAGLKELLREIETQEDALGTMMDALDADQEEGLNDLANILGEMDPEVAAGSIVDMDPERAAALLRLLPQKDSAKILDEILDAADRALILDYIGEPTY